MIEKFRKTLEAGKKITWNDFAVYMCTEHNWTRDLLKTALKNNPEFRKKVEPFVELEN